MPSIFRRLKIKNIRQYRYRQKPVATVAVIGGGSWATALVKILSENRVKVKWWLRNAKAAKHIRRYRHNPDYLSSVRLPRRYVKATRHLQGVFEGTSHIIVAIPAAFVADALAHLDPKVFEGKIVVSAVKGMVPQKHTLISEWITAQFGVQPSQMAAIAGPCHAEEVALGKQSYLTIAAPDEAVGTQVANFLKRPYLKAHTNPDLYGVEYAAVIKNIIALAGGIALGLNYGDNFQAVLVANATQEIKRFLDKVCPYMRDVNDSVYLGDLLVTAYSQFSRNRTFGSMIGRGYSVQSAQLEMNMIAEGYYATKSIYQIQQHYQVNMPITKAVYKILYEKSAPALEFSILRDLMR